MAVSDIPIQQQQRKVTNSFPSTLQNIFEVGKTFNGAFARFKPF